MVDVSQKRTTLRTAKARGVLYADQATIERVRANDVPKGDVLATARAAGIMAAKQCSDMLVFCHSLPVDYADITFEIRMGVIEVIAEVRTVWKTGVEMEAITAVTVALLNMVDMLKPIQSNLTFGDVGLVAKKGGKSDFSDTFTRPLKTAVLVISDSTFEGKREDKSGQIIKRFLEKHPVAVECYEVLPDEEDYIEARLTRLADDKQFQLIFTTGGTGIGPRDITPEVTAKVIERELPGIAEAMRTHGLARTPYSMLSRQIVGIRGECIIVNLPGSSRGVVECLHALFPGVLHAFPMMWGGGHG